MVRLPQEIIRHKRDGGTLDAEHIEHFIEGLTAGHVSEGQAASFAMAMFFRGLSVPERVALTRAMMNSGDGADMGPARTGARQAFDRRRRRYGQPRRSRPPSRPAAATCR